MLPVAYNAFSIIHDDVERRVTGADIAGKPDLRTHTLADDVPVGPHHPYLRAAFKAWAFGYHTGAAAEHASTRVTLGGLRERFTQNDADGVAHNQKITAGNRSGITMGCEVDKVVGYDDVPGVK